MTTKASIRRKWKAIETKIAKFIGGKRVPVTGRQRGDAPDIEHNWLGVECKFRSSLPNWIHDAMDQAVKSSRPRQLPCVILAEKGSRTEDYYFIVRLGDAKDWWL